MNAQNFRPSGFLPAEQASDEPSMTILPPVGAVCSFHVHDEAPEKTCRITPVGGVLIGIALAVPFWLAVAAGCWYVLFGGGQ